MKRVSLSRNIIEESQRREQLNGCSEELSVAKADLCSLFVFRTAKQRTLYPLIRRHVLPGTTIISDDWPAYRKIGKQLGKPMGYSHYIIQHKKQFAR